MILTANLPIAPRELLAIDNSTDARLNAIEYRVREIERRLDLMLLQSDKLNSYRSLGPVRKIPRSVVAKARNAFDSALGTFSAASWFKDGRNVGLRLFAVTEDSYLKGVGLLDGDIVLSVDDVQPQDPFALLNALLTDKPGESVTHVIKLFRFDRGNTDEVPLPRYLEREIK